VRRVWADGDRKPLDNPMVTDKHGRLWRWDPNLMFWIYERADGSIKASCPSWQSLMQYVPLAER
jgi:hypothetical protein